MAEDSKETVWKQIENALQEEEFCEVMAGLKVIIEILPPESAEKLVRKVGAFLGLEISEETIEKAEKLMNWQRELRQAILELQIEYGIFPDSSLSEEEVEELANSPRFLQFQEKVKRVYREFLSRLSPAERGTVKIMEMVDEKIIERTSSSQEEEEPW